MKVESYVILVVNSLGHKTSDRMMAELAAQVNENAVHGYEPIGGPVWTGDCVAQAIVAYRDSNARNSASR